MEGGISVVYFTDPTEFEHRLNKLHSITTVHSLQIIPLIRNPFNNIATIIKYGSRDHHENVWLSKICALKNNLFKNLDAKIQLARTFAIPIA